MGQVFNRDIHVRHRIAEVGCGLVFGGRVVGVERGNRHVIAAEQSRDPVFQSRRPDRDRQKKGQQKRHQNRKDVFGPFDRFGLGFAAGTENGQPHFFVGGFGIAVEFGNHLLRFGLQLGQGSSIAFRILFRAAGFATIVQCGEAIAECRFCRGRCRYDGRKRRGLVFLLGFRWDGAWRCCENRSGVQIAGRGWNADRGGDCRRDPWLDRGRRFVPRGQCRCRGIRRPCTAREHNGFGRLFGFVRRFWRGFWFCLNGGRCLFDGGQVYIEVDIKL